MSTVWLIARREFRVRTLSKASLISSGIMIAIIVIGSLIAKPFLTGDDEPATVQVDTATAGDLVPYLHAAAEAQDAAYVFDEVDAPAEPAVAEDTAGLVVGPAQAPTLYLDGGDETLTGIVQVATQQYALTAAVEDLGGDPGEVATALAGAVPKGQRRLDGLDGMIVSLYAGGMTLRDIQHHLASTIGTDLSHETIAKITDQIGDEVLAWQTRPLEALYPVIYLDAIVVKVRDGGHVRNKAAHIAVGVDMDGIKHVLGIWVQTTEGAKFWASVCSELANRGVRDVLIVCCDGLTGFPEARSIVSRIYIQVTQRA